MTDWDEYDRDEFLADLGIDVQVLDSPLIDHHLSILRDEETDPRRYEESTKDLMDATAYEVSRSLPTEDIEVETPMAETDGTRITDTVVLPILRAGLAGREGFYRALKETESGFISAWRDEDLDVEVEYMKVPEMDGKTAVLVDPMIATGNTATAAYGALEEDGPPDEYVFVSFIAAPEGLEMMDDYFDDGTTVYTCAIDDAIYEEDFRSPGLDGDGYIVPGLGDAGDRTYGTPDE